MCQAALSCGLVAVGSCHGELTESLLQAIMEHADKHSNETHLRHLALGLALLYLGKVFYLYYPVPLHSETQASKML